MKILNWYVTRGFLVAFFMAILVLTFGMTGANLVKVLVYVSQGVSFWDFCRFTVSILPIILTFTVPWAVMVAVMVVFGRMSADNEITAMRACGVSIMQIVSPILIITFLLTLLCLYLQVEIGPPLLGRSRSIMKEAVINRPMSIFEPGKPIEYEDTIIYIDDKSGTNQLKGVQMYRMTDNNSAIAQDISAETGEILVDEEKQVMTIVLYNCLISDKFSDRTGSIERLFSKEMRFGFDYGSEINNAPVTNRAKFMRLTDLMGRIRLTREINRDTTELEVELNQRIAFALSPVAFLLLGLPLAIRTSRRETSVGLFLSVILAGVFFLSIILCESLCSYPKLYPQYLLWLPNIIFQALGAWMTYRISQR